MTLNDALKALSPDEKLAIVTDLWDDLSTTASLHLPLEELGEMQRRRDELLADPGIAIDAEELWRRVDGG